MNRNTIIGIIIAIVAIGAAFYGGMKYQQHAGISRAGFASGSARGSTAAFGRAALGALGGAASGKVIASDADSITVQSADGSTKIVLVASSTQILKTASGSVSDLSDGTDVSVIGSANSDGSVTAQSVSIRPAGSVAGAASARGR